MACRDEGGASSTDDGSCNCRERTHASSSQSAGSMRRTRRDGRAAQRAAPPGGCLQGVGDAGQAEGVACGEEREEAAREGDGEHAQAAAGSRPRSLRPSPRAAYRRAACRGPAGRSGRWHSRCPALPWRCNGYMSRRLEGSGGGAQSVAERRRRLGGWSARAAAQPDGKELLQGDCGCRCSRREPKEGVRD